MCFENKERGKEGSEEGREREGERGREGCRERKRKGKLLDLVEWHVTCVFKFYQLAVAHGLPWQLSASHHRWYGKV